MRYGSRYFSEFLIAVNGITIHQGNNIQMLCDVLGLILKWKVHDLWMNHTWLQRGHLPFPCHLTLGKLNNLQGSHFFFHLLNRNKYVYHTRLLSGLNCIAYVKHLEECWAYKTYIFHTYTSPLSSPPISNGLTDPIDLLLKYFMSLSSLFILIEYVFIKLLLIKCFQ